MIEVGYDEEIDFSYDKGLTISTAGNPSWKKLFAAIHKAIIRAEKKTKVRRRLRALLIGESKEGSARSRVWHLEFSRIIDDEEKKEIEKIIKERNVDFPEPRSGVLIKWGIENNGFTKNYVLANPLHTKFKPCVVRG